MKVPLLDLTGQFASMKKEIMAEIEAVCDSQMFILGSRVTKFESEIAGYCGAAASCGVSSGSDALLVSLMAEGIGPGDEVITVPFTFFATVGAVARVGAKVVFADIDPRTFTLDPAKLEKALTPRTKAIIPVHLFGQACDMDPIMKFAAAHDLTVIEDAAQAIGTEYRGKRVGSFGKYGCFSFFPSKNLGCFGDGGIVTTDTAESAERLRIFRNHGMNPKYYHKFIGGNFRLDALQAAVLSVKLRYLDGWTAARQANAAEYEKLFREAGLLDKVTLPFKAEYASRHIYNQFSILISGGLRDKVKDALRAADVGTDVYYPVPLHMQECFRELGYREGDFPCAEKCAREILALPIYPESTTAMREYVVSVIAGALA